MNSLKVIAMLPRLLPRLPALRALLLGTSALGAVWTHALAADPLPAIPPNVAVKAASPMIMLNMSRDHQLFYRAYNEYSDLDGDGAPETGYKHSIAYGGYFDSGKCYTYSSASSRFNPSRAVTDKYCGESDEWSGNFLNWATMTRMDLVRKVLYGGSRSTDTTDTTVLERAHLVTDGHSFAKYHATTAAEMRKLTPFSEAELTLCSTSRPSDFSGTGAWSQTQTNPPLMRAVKGNYLLWGANERSQCQWHEEKDNYNNNDAAKTGLNAASKNPKRDSTDSPALGSKDYTVRVKVCVSGKLGGERCQAYGSSLKPIGLLHDYGATDQAEFGLITGSYTNNIRGGVLRRNIGSFAGEVSATDGTFTSVDGIVRTLDRLRLYGFRQSDGTYWAGKGTGSGSDFCDYQTIGLTNGRCQSWGNPMGEMYLEALRYLGGKSVTSDFNYSGTSNPDGELGLTKETWVDPYLRGGTTEQAAIEAKYGKGQCRKSTIVNFNASVTSYDGDDLGGYSDLPSASGSVADLMNSIGSAEGIHGYGWSVGNNTTDGTANSCTVKTVGQLGDVRGLCPDGPGYKGSFSLAGLAWWAHNHPVRTDYSKFGVTAATAKDAFKVNTFSVALSPAKPRIEISTPSGKKIVISPSYRLVKSATQIGSGTLVDFRIIEQDATHGRYLINWEDSEQGGDYDMDALGLLSWSLNGDALTVTTQMISQATGNGQGFGYSISGVKNPDTGVAANGMHYHSGILGFSYTDPVPIKVTKTDGGATTKVDATGGCNNCQVDDVATMASYTAASGSVLSVLQDPLWYAAKWGGFENSNTTDTTPIPDKTSEWDSEINATGASGSDGVPDNYFVVFRPDELERALRSAFQKIIDASNNAPAVSSSQLVDGSLKYVASFSPEDGHGSLSAYKLTSSGFESAPTWKAEKTLGDTPPASRRIITSKDVDGVQTGIALTWSSLSEDQQAALTGSDTSTVAQGRIDWLRGSRSAEGVTYKARNADSILGSVVNASPWIQGVPEASYRGTDFVDGASQTYAQFRAARLSRRKLLWMAANDGMVHAFDASTGVPALSYLPEPLFSRLRGITLPSAPNVIAMADGSPFVADIIAPAGASTAWRSYLFGSLGRSVPGIYALDVTNTATVTSADVAADSLKEANAGKIFKWQFSGANDSTGDEDLGYIVADIGIHRLSNQPVNVAKMNNGEFALILGNGAKSKNGVAALFILLTKGPDASGSWTGRYKKIVVDSAGGNGLMQPNWIDSTGDGIPDFIYAGDLKGNVWKFDVSNEDWSKWGVAFPSTETPKLPLYTAYDTDGITPLPISTMPQLRFHPKGGVVVVFGTGVAMVKDDFPKLTQTQRLFGIWDSPDYGTTTTELTGTGKKALPRGTGELVTRTLTRTSSTAFLTGSTIDWATKKGWVMAWPTSGETVIANPVGLSDLVAVTSIAPGTTSCEDGPSAYLTFVDPISGLLNEAVMGTASVTVSGSTVTVNVASTPILDQKITIARDARRTGTPLSGAAAAQQDALQADQRKYLAIGKRGTEDLDKKLKIQRVGWREIPTLTSR